MDQCLTWTQGSEEGTREKGRWDPSKQKILGRVRGRSELRPSPEPARRPSHVLLARLSSHVWSPGPWGACATAALLHFSLDAPYSPPNSGPRISDWSHLSSKAVSSGSRSSTSAQRNSASPLGNLPALGSPPPRFLPDQLPDWPLPNSVSQWEP